MAAVSGFESSFFTLEFIADGIYAAIAKGGTGSMANAGLVDLGEQILLFDTMYTPQAARSLREAALHLFGRPISLVINSHFHLDHVGGNQVFADLPILSTVTTRNLMLDRTQQFLSFAKANPGYPAILQKAIEEESDESKREELSLQLGDILAMDAALAELAPVPASMTFGGLFTFHGSKRTAALIPMGNGHSACDTVLYLPDDQVLFAADLLFAKNHPNIKDGNVPEWLRILGKMDSYPAQVIIPGHGPVSDQLAILDLRDYFTHLLDTAKQTETTKREAADSLESLLIPKQFETWSLPNQYTANLQHLVRLQQSS